MRVVSWQARTQTKERRGGCWRDGFLCRKSRCYIEYRPMCQSGSGTGNDDGIIGCVKEEINERVENSRKSNQA